MVWVITSPEGDFWTISPGANIEIFGLPTWSPDKRWIAYTFIEQETISLHLFDTMLQTSINLEQEFPKEPEDSLLTQSELLVTGWSPDSQWLGFVYNWDESYLLNVETKERLKITPSAQFLFWDMKGSGQFAYTDFDANLFVGSIEKPTGRLLKALPSPIYRIHSIDWHPNNDELLIATADTTSGANKLWSFDIEKETWSLLFESSIRAMKWSTSGEQIAVSGSNELTVFDVETSEIVNSFQVNDPVFDLYWLNEEYILLRVPSDILLLSIHDTDQIKSVMKKESEIFELLGDIKYLDW